MFNSIPSDRYVADKRFAADVYSVSQHSRKPMLAAWRSCRTEAVLIAGWVSLEALASGKVLQVLASVMQALWALANVCPLMRGVQYLVGDFYFKILLLPPFSKTDCRHAC